MLCQWGKERPGWELSVEARKGAPANDAKRAFGGQG
jgi:hypothetical protein